jgi:hypothetical protein
MESGSVVVWKCENALKGTALLVVELVAPAEVAPPLVVVELDFNAFAGAVSVFAEGVYNAEEVSAFEPADVEPTEDEEDAAAPVVPADELLCR